MCASDWSPFYVEPLTSVSGGLQGEVPERPLGKSQPSCSLCSVGIHTSGSFASRDLISRGPSSHLPWEVHSGKGQPLLGLDV